MIDIEYMNRILLIPLSIIYLIYLNIKNFLFISGILKSTQFNIPVICIGNLSFGGSGKTPHTDFIVNFLKKTLFSLFLIL